MGLLICYIIAYFSFYRSIIVFLTYVIITWLLCMFANFYESRRLINYVKKHYNNEYKKMKSFNGKENVHNGFATLAFVFSSNDWGDDFLIKLKMNYKKVVLLILALFSSYMILYLIIMFSKNIK